MHALEKILKDIEERIEKLNEDAGKYEDSGAVDLARLNDREIYGLKTASNIIRSHMEDDGWIPAEYPPKDDKPILLSFEFYDFTSKGRYIKDDKGGAYFMDGVDGSCISQGIIVNAWYPLPAAPYRPQEEKNP